MAEDGGLHGYLANPKIFRANPNVARHLTQSLPNPLSYQVLLYHHFTVAILYCCCMTVQLLLCCCIGKAVIAVARSNTGRSISACIYPTPCDTKECPVDRWKPRDDRATSWPDPQKKSSRTSEGPRARVARLLLVEPDSN